MYCYDSHSYRTEARSMTTISIHGLDADAERKLRERAREQNQSLNKTIKRILAEDLGAVSRKGRRRKRFEKFCGRWSQQDLDEFRAATEEFDRVNPEDWA